MKAHSGTVCARFLGAHKQRSLRMVMQFKQTLLAPSSASSSSTSTANALALASTTGDPGNSVNQRLRLQDITLAREFHQSLVVGLIEACKGIQELYNTHVDASAGSIIPIDISEEEKAADSALEEKQAAGATTATTTEKERTASFNALLATISAVMPEYVKTILLAFQMFFKK
jgi:hypothetical protein